MSKLTRPPKSVSFLGLIGDLAISGGETGFPEFSPRESGGDRPAMPTNWAKLKSFDRSSHSGETIKSIDKNWCRLRATVGRSAAH